MRQVFAGLASQKTLVNVGALLSGSSVARVLSAFSIFILARQLGVENFGLYTASLSLARLSSVLFSLGLDSWLLRQSGRERSEFALAIGSNLALKSGVGMLWMVLVPLGASFLNQDTFPVGLVLLSAVSTFFEELTATAWSAFKSALRNTITVWLVMAAPALMLVLTIVLSVLDVSNIAYYLGVRIVAFTLVGAWSLFKTYQIFGIGVRTADLPSVLRETTAFGLSHGLALIYERADITIVALVLGKTAAGLYAPSVSLTTTLFLIPLAIYEVMLPLISKIYHEQAGRVRKVAFQLFLLSALLGILLGLGMAVGAHPLVWLVYGQEYAASGQILVILSNVLVFKTISFALAAVVAAVGWQGRRVVVQAISAGFNVLVNLLIVRRYGIEGIAYVYVFTEFLLMSGYLAILLRWQRQIQQPKAAL